MIKTIIFDFDGTIADTFDSVIKISHNILREGGHQGIKKSEKEFIRNMNPNEIIKYFNISRIKIPSLLKRARNTLNKNIGKLKTPKPLKKTLLKLKEGDYRLAILTSNSKENVLKFLKKNKLEVFDIIYSKSSVFGKQHKIKRLLKSHKLKLKETVYVGDEIRDIESCKKIGMKIIAVSWGYNSKKLLKKQKPDFLIDKSEDLIKIVKRL